MRPSGTLPTPSPTGEKYRPIAEIVEELEALEEEAIETNIALKTILKAITF